MRKLLSLVLFSLFVIMIAGCGKGDVEIKTMSMFGGTDPHAETYEALLAAFEKKHDITIFELPVGGSRVDLCNINDNSATSDEIWKTSVLTAFYSGVEPDVLFYFTGEVAKPLVTNDYVVSIEEIRK